MGERSVYRSKINEKLVAVKKYESDEASWTEIEIMSNYSHPNIMSASSLVIEDGKVVGVAMELGSSVKEPTEQTIIDLCSGMGFLHSKGVLHMDTKTDNIINVEGIFKLIDFDNSLIFTPEMIRRGVYVNFLGTSRLSNAPESAEEYLTKKKVKVSTKNDIFALGWTLLCLFDPRLERDLNDGYPIPVDDLINSYMRVYGREPDWSNHYEPSVLLHNYYKDKYQIVDDRIPKTFPNRSFYVDLISRMLSYDPELRPEMNEVFDIESGTISIYIPPAPQEPLNISHFSNSNADVFFVMQAIDLVTRIQMLDSWKNGSDNVRKGMKRNALYRVSTASFKTEWGEWLNDDGEYVKEGVLNFRPLVGNFPSFYQDLHFSTISCNLLYRISPNLECLAEMLKMKLDYSTIDWFEVYNRNKELYPYESKMMSFSDFYKRYLS